MFVESKVSINSDSFDSHHKLTRSMLYQSSNEDFFPKKNYSRRGGHIYTCTYAHLTQTCHTRAPPVDMYYTYTSLVKIEFLRMKASADI